MPISDVLFLVVCLYQKVMNTSVKQVAKYLQCSVIFSNMKNPKDGGR